MEASLRENSHLTREIQSLERVIVDSYRTTHRIRDKVTVDAGTQASCVACELHTQALADLAAAENRERLPVSAAKIQQSIPVQQGVKPALRQRPRERPSSAPTRRKTAAERAAQASSNAAFGKTNR